MAYQGQYPVISVSLKSMKQASYTNAFYMYKNLIAKEYEKHKIILESNKILDSEKEVFQNIMEQRADQNVYLNFIRTLSDILAKYYEKNVIILIDEYDVPYAELVYWLPRSECTMAPRISGYRKFAFFSVSQHSSARIGSAMARPFGIRS